MPAMDRQAEAKFWVVVEEAAGFLAEEFPETAPIEIDRSAMRAGFASGELVGLESLGTRESGAILDHLRLARLAGRELAEFSVASWKASSPRLGLVLRRWHHDGVGIALGAGWMLRVCIGSQYGLVAVSSRHLTPWRQSIGATTKRAIRNSLADQVRSGPVPSCDPAVRIWLLVGGGFAAGRLIAVESMIGPIGDSRVGAMMLGDRALLVGRAQRRNAPASLVASVLDEAAQRLTTVSPARGEGAWFGLDHARGVMVQCRSDGLLAVLEPGSNHDERDHDESGGGHEPDGPLRRRDPSSVVRSELWPRR